MELYKQVEAVARDYLGNQANPFLERQCRYHVGVELQDLTPEDLGSLAWWCFISGGLVIDNQKAVKFQQQIEELKEKAGAA